MKSDLRAHLVTMGSLCQDVLEYDNAVIALSEGGAMNMYDYLAGVAIEIEKQFQPDDASLYDITTSVADQLHVWSTSDSTFPPNPDELVSYVREQLLIAERERRAVDERLTAEHLALSERTQ